MKIALIYPDAFSIWHFHQDLLRALKEKGHDVYTISTIGEHVKYIEGLGVVHIPVRMNRFMNPMKDIRFMLELYRIFRKYRFDIVHNFTIKPNIYGAVAAKLAGINRIIGTAEGLGFMYADEPGLKIRMMRPLVNALYRLGCRLTHRFWFVNPDDLDLFVTQKIISREKVFLAISAGVSLKEYFPGVIDEAKTARLKKEWNLSDGTKVIAMIVARVIWSKGVREFLEASELLRNRYPSVKFFLIGPVETDSPESVQEAFLREKERTGNFKWLGFRKDIKEIYAMSDLVVLPSYYREGVPNVLLEAMALGKAIITTNYVGCKEVVEDGRNGYLVPVRNSRALADAMEILINDDEKRKAFGQYSRTKVENEFDKKMIIGRIMKELYQIC